MVDTSTVLYTPQALTYISEVVQSRTYTLASGHLQMEVNTIMRIVSDMKAGVSPEIVKGEKRSPLFTKVSQFSGSPSIY